MWFRKAFREYKVGIGVSSNVSIRSFQMVSTFEIRMSLSELIVTRHRII